MENRKDREQRVLDEIKRKLGFDDAEMAGMFDFGERNGERVLVPSVAKIYALENEAARAKIYKILKMHKKYKGARVEMG